MGGIMYVCIYVCTCVCMYVHRLAYVKREVEAERD